MKFALRINMLKRPVLKVDGSGQRKRGRTKYRPSTTFPFLREVDGLDGGTIIRAEEHGRKVGPF